MAAVDAAAVAAGTPGIALMRAAGAAVAARARGCLPGGGRVLILCGPGNNGGDGFVAARLLAEAGYGVERRAARRSLEALSGDAALAAAVGAGRSRPCRTSTRAEADLVIDALFGAGLARDLDGRRCPRRAHQRLRALPVLSVDIPSGLDGETGRVRGVACAPARA